MNLASSTDSRVSLRARFRTATREAILDAAADLLGADGGTHTRMEDIAARAGVAVGTVYNYFQDRAALVSALLQTRTSGLLEALDASADASGAKGRRTTAAAAFEAELERFVSALGAHFDANRFLLTVLREEEGNRGIDAHAESRRRTVVEELLARAERLMEKGIRSRALRKDDRAVYAALLIGMIRGVAIAALTRQHAFSPARTAAIVRVFLTGAAR